MAGDCGSLARAFIDIATNFLLIKEVKKNWHTGGNGWYLGPGFHEIDSDRAPNVEGGGYYFKTCHVWVEWGDEVYDVLFGEKGQNGREADEKTKAGGITEFKIDEQWYRGVPGKNKYNKKT